MKKNLLFILICLFAIPSFGQIIVTGVCDGDLPGGLPKAAEFYVTQNIADLSPYGVTSSNNGNFAASDTVEWNFPAISASAGDFLYVSLDSASFRDFMGFDADFAVNIGSHSPTQINGDDAILVVEGTTDIINIIDVFGEKEWTDPQPWTHTDGWVYRNDNTGPDGATFVESNWTIMSGVLDGFATNAAATNPWPAGTFSNPTGIADINPTSFLKIANNPVGNELRFMISHDQSEMVTFKVIDLLGNLIQVERNQLNAGTETFSMDVSNLSRGIYFLSIEQGKDIVVRKWIKQ